MDIKMNINCFLISYGFINILAVNNNNNIVDYIKKAFIKNKHIELAGDRLHTVITNIIYGKPSIADYIKEVDITNRHIKLAGDGMQSVITHIISGNASMEKIAYMLIVPELANTGNLRQCIKDQTDMQREIFNAISLPVPYIKNQTLPEPDIENQMSSYSEGEVMNSSDFDELLVLGTERRSETEKAVRFLFKNAIKDKHSRDSEFSFYSRMCRLKGLVKSIENPNLYIINAEFRQEDYSCLLTAVDRSVESYTSYALWG